MSPDLRVVGTQPLARHSPGAEISIHTVTRPLDTRIWGEVSEVGTDVVTQRLTGFEPGQRGQRTGVTVIILLGIWNLIALNIQVPLVSYFDKCLFPR